MISLCINRISCSSIISRHGSLWVARGALQGYFLFYNLTIINNNTPFSKLPAYQTIYRCISLQGLGLLYFGLRFRPNSTFSIEAPEELVSAIDLAACCCLVAGIIGTFIYAPQIAKGILSD